jgi:predicted  nucleic acid-binding Zn-ribbon protein
MAKEKESWIRKFHRVEALVAGGHTLAAALETVGFPEKHYEHWRAAHESREAEPIDPAVDASRSDDQAAMKPAQDQAVRAPERPEAATIQSQTETPAERPAERPLATDSASSLPIAGSAATPRPYAERQSSPWRTVLLAACLVSGPAIAIAATVILVDRAKTTDETLQNHEASLASLRQSGAASAVDVESLRQDSQRARQDLSRVQSRIDGVSKAQESRAAVLSRKDTELATEIANLRRDEASDRNSLARLQTQVADVSQAQAPLATELDRLRREAVDDRIQVGQVQAKLGESMRALSPLAASLERQRTDFVAEIDRLRRDAAGVRAELAGLETKLGESVRGLSPVTALLEQQQAELAGQLNRLRQDVSFYRAGLTRLEDQVATIVQTTSQKKEPPAADATASIPPPDLGGLSRRPPTRSAADTMLAALPQSATPRVILGQTRARSRLGIEERGQRRHRRVSALQDVRGGLLSEGGLRVRPGLGTRRARLGRGGRPGHYSRPLPFFEAIRLVLAAIAEPPRPRHRHRLAPHYPRY